MNSLADITTDGWRGKPSSRWSELEVLEKAAAFAANVDQGKAIAIGFDGRAGSRDIAMLAAQAFTNMGRACRLSSEITTTPAVGRFVAGNDDVVLGLVFTASHNPPGDFGLKVRLHDGLSPLQLPPAPKQWQDVANFDFTANQVIKPDNRINEYYDTLVCKPFNELVKKFPGEVVFDAVSGALGAMAGAVDAVRWRRQVPAPFFFGATPDPVLRLEAEPRMASAIAECKDPDSAIVLMTDGDGDRLCLYTCSSGYVTSTEQAMALIYSRLPVRQVISTCVVESTLRQVAESGGAEYRWTQVGFKNITADWKTTGQGATIGVEPNGGLAYAQSADSFFERDGMATALLILSHFGSVKKLDEAIKAVRDLRQFDSRQFVTPLVPEKVTSMIAAAWPEATVNEQQRIHELLWPSGWRVLVRRSGTEPLTRCYVEGPEELFNWFKSTFTA